MRLARVALIVTCVAVAALGGWFVVARWEDANKVAAVASALGAVAAVGVAMWAAVRAPDTSRSVTLSDTGRAEAGAGSQAITGVSGKAGAVPGPVRVERTGEATASKGGDAVTGVQLD